MKDLESDLEFIKGSVFAFYAWLDNFEGQIKRMRRTLNVVERTLNKYENDKNAD